MRSLTALAAAGVLGAVTLTGCGGNDVQAYCDTVKADKKALSGPQSPGDFESYVTTTKELADKAPDEIEPQWRLASRTFSELSSTLRKQGFTPAKLNKMIKDPRAADPQEIAKLQKTMGQLQEQLATSKLQKAGQKIQKYTKKECGVDLSAL